MAKGVVRQPQKIKTEWVLSFWGGPKPPPGPWGWSGYPKKWEWFDRFGRFGVVEPPFWPWEWFDHLKIGRVGGSNHPIFKNF
jgi:hypothetical protein